MELLQNTKDVPSRSTLIVWGEFLEPRIAFPN